MRASQYLLPTLKETPADASVISHQLMLRAGMIRKLASGLYSWLPLGLRVLRKAENIVREEMNKSGAQEVLMPIVQPAQLWENSKRWEKYGPELLRFKDRHANDFCLGPTHEEVITDLISNELSSYKQLPINLYQIQTKFRDEIRPRFGVMRAREFIMKDAYSFHADQASLQKTYDVMHTTYTSIFTRFGLDFRPVLADTGSIGGNSSHEFHILADSGEDAIAFSDSGDYAANIEKAEAFPCEKTRGVACESMRLVDTPNTKTISELVERFNIPIEKTIKTLVVHGVVKGSLVALIVRGDHELNGIKAAHLPQVAYPLTLASETEIRASIGASTGSLGPLNLPLPCVVDRTVALMSDFAAGANIDGKHYFGLNWERDLALPEVADLRNVLAGDPSPDGIGTLVIKRGIEVGHIFQLGTGYAEALNARFLNDEGREQVMTMGCYGIGVSRVVAGAIEQKHDSKGIIWPDALAPFDVALVPVNKHKSPAVSETCERLYIELQAAGFDVLYMDEDKARLGGMLADVELIGIPHRLVISERGLSEGKIEYRHRRADENEMWDADSVISQMKTRKADNRLAESAST